MTNNTRMMTSIDNLPLQFNDQNEKDDQLIQDILQDIQGATTNSESMYQRQMDNNINLSMSSSASSSPNTPDDVIDTPPSRPTIYNVSDSITTPNKVTAPSSPPSSTFFQSSIKMATDIILFVILFVLLNHPLLMNLFSKIPYLGTSSNYPFVSSVVLGILGGVLYYYLQKFI